MRGASAGWEARATAGQETGATFRPLHNHAVRVLEPAQAPGAMKDRPEPCSFNGGHFPRRAAELFPGGGVTTDDGSRDSPSNELNRELHRDASFPPVWHPSRDGKKRDWQRRNMKMNRTMLKRVIPQVLALGGLVALTGVIALAQAPSPDPGSVAARPAGQRSDGQIERLKSAQERPDYCRYHPGRGYAVRNGVERGLQRTG